MSTHAESFIKHLEALAGRDRGAMAALRRSLGFAPGAYPPAFPVVERFAGLDGTRESLRHALYLAAGLYAVNPRHLAGRSVASALAHHMQERQSTSIERRFIALLSADAESLPTHLRYVVQLLGSSDQRIDYVSLIGDLAIWLDAWKVDERDRVRRRWARDFYRHSAAVGSEDAAPEMIAETEDD